MKRKTHTTAIVVIPPEALWDSIQKIRKEHDRQFRRWMPHITMIYPFRPAEEFDALVEQFSFSCQSIQPFSITLSRFNHFYHRKGN
ncbi:MAG: 2'-5' RNA ligase family protein, partial [bacterium]